MSLDRVDGDRVVESVVEACRSWSELLARELSLLAGGRGATVAQRWLGRDPGAVPRGHGAESRRRRPRRPGPRRRHRSGGAPTAWTTAAPAGTTSGSRWAATRSSCRRFLPVLESVGLVVAEEMTFALGGPRLHPSEPPLDRRPGVGARPAGGPTRRERRPGRTDPPDRRGAGGVLVRSVRRRPAQRARALRGPGLAAGRRAPRLRPLPRPGGDRAPDPRRCSTALADNPAVASALWHRFERRFRPAPRADGHPRRARGTTDQRRATRCWPGATRSSASTRTGCLRRLPRPRRCHRPARTCGPYPHAMRSVAGPSTAPASRRRPTPSPGGRSGSRPPTSRASTSGRARWPGAASGGRTARATSGSRCCSSCRPRR